MKLLQIFIKSFKTFNKSIRYLNLLKASYFWETSAN